MKFALGEDYEYIDYRVALSSSSTVDVNEISQSIIFFTLYFTLSIFSHISKFMVIKQFALLGYFVRICFFTFISRKTSLFSTYVPKWSLAN